MGRRPRDHSSQSIRQGCNPDRGKHMDRTRRKRVRDQSDQGPEVDRARRPKRVMPGRAMAYTATVSAVLHGSMSMHDILWNLSLARGRQLEMEWWIVTRGIECVRRRP